MFYCYFIRLKARKKKSANHEKLGKYYSYSFNPLSANLTKWSNTNNSLFPTNCLGLFDYFVELKLKGILYSISWSNQC